MADRVVVPGNFVNAEHYITNFKFIDEERMLVFFMARNQKYAQVALCNYKWESHWMVVKDSFWLCESVRENLLMQINSY